MALNDLESDLDEKIIEKHLEEIEERHEGEIRHFIAEEEQNDSQRATRRRPRSPVHVDTKEDEHALRSTLEALSDRTVVSTPR